MWAVFAPCPGLMLHHVLRFDCTVVGNLSHAPVYPLSSAFVHCFAGYLSKFSLRDFLFFQGIIERILTLKLLLSRRVHKTQLHKRLSLPPRRNVSATFQFTASLLLHSSTSTFPFFSPKKNQFTEYQFIIT